MHFLMPFSYIMRYLFHLFSYYIMTIDIEMLFNADCSILVGLVDSFPFSPSQSFYSLKNLIFHPSSLPSHFLSLLFIPIIPHFLPPFSFSLSLLYPSFLPPFSFSLSLIYPSDCSFPPSLLIFSLSCLSQSFLITSLPSHFLSLLFIPVSCLPSHFLSLIYPSD